MITISLYLRLAKIHLRVLRHELFQNVILLLLVEQARVGRGGGGADIRGNGGKPSQPLRTTCVERCGCLGISEDQSHI